MSRFVSFAFLVVSLAAFSGCVGALDRTGRPRVAAMPPESWTAARNSAAPYRPDAWLDDFRDATLRGLIEEALQYNHNLAAARARMEAVFAGIRLQTASRLPQIDANANASRTQRTSSSGFQITGSRTNNYNVGVAVNWELDVWGRRRHRVNAAVADFLSTRAGFEAAQLSLAAAVARLWYTAVESRLQIELAERRVSSFKNSLDIIETGQRAGTSSALDVHLARADVANAQSDLIVRRRVMDDNLRSLEVLLGRYPAAEISADTVLPEITSVVPAGLPSELLSRRPDLIAAHQTLEAALERQEDESRNYLPDIRLTGNGGTSGDALRNLLNWNFLVWNIAGGLVQPVFRGGTLAARRTVSHAAYDAAVADYAHAVLVAFSEVERALVAGATLEEQRSALDAARTELTQAEVLALERYRKGLEDVNTVLSTQRQTFAAESAVIALRNSQLQRRLDLYLALGGPFLPSSDDAAAPVGSTKPE